jgi:hypothetical protein
MLTGAFKVGNLELVWRLINHGELGLLNAHNGDLKYHEQTILYITAHYSSLKIF